MATKQIHQFIKNEKVLQCQERKNRSDNRKSKDIPNENSFELRSEKDSLKRWKAGRAWDECQPVRKIYRAVSERDK